MKKEESSLSIRIRDESQLFLRIRAFLASFFGVLFWIFYWLDCISWNKTVSPDQQLYQAFTEKGLLIGRFFEMREELPGLYLCLIVGILGLFLLFAVLGRKKLLLVGLTGGLALLLLLRTGWMPGIVSLIFLCLCWLTLFVPSFKAGVLLAGGAVLLLLSFSKVSENVGWTGFRKQWEQWRYNENEKILPQGQMEKAKSQERGEEEALSIRMEQPSVYYLRGFTGTVFENNAWSNRQGTFSQYWQSDGRNDLAETAGKYDGILKNALDIQNTGASRRYLYLPYECTTGAGTFEDEKKAVYGTGDNYYATGLTGAGNYSCASWECMAQAVGGSQDSSAVSDRKNDSYSEYVYTTCLMLTREEKEAVAGLLGKKKANAGVSALSVLREIRKWMKENLEYVTEPGAISEGESFVNWFLTEEKKGFDVQYATAAVMFFRYYGIPSRYVEGYLVTQEAVSSPDSSGTITVKEKDAHAWPEIYLEETGWIPVEVLEEYEEKMGISYLELLNDPAVGQSSQAEELSEEETEKTASADSSDEKQETKQNSNTADTTELSDDSGNVEESLINIEETQKHTGKRKLWLLSPILLASVFVVRAFALRQKQMQEERRWKESEDYGFCVTMYYRKLLLVVRRRLAKERKQNKSLPDLSRKDTLIRILQQIDPEVDREAFEECYLIRQKAIYGNIPLTIEERDTACAFLEEEINKWGQNW